MLLSQPGSGVGRGGIVTASKHAETEDNSLADIGAIQIGDVTVTREQALGEGFICLEPYKVTHTGISSKILSSVGSATTVDAPVDSFDTTKTITWAKNDFRGLQLVGKRQEVTIDQCGSSTQICCAGRTTLRIGYCHGVKVPIVSRKNAKAQPDVFQVTGTLDFLRLGLGFSQGRQQHARQNGDDGDHDQQLDERESAYFRFFKR